MSKLFVCLGKKTTIPYSIPGEQIRIFSLEELCYYICERVNVLDRSLMKESLLDFLARELELPALAERLEEIVRRERPLCEFCGAVLEYAAYPEKEMRSRIIEMIRENEKLPVAERLKRQGDTYAKQRRYNLAQKMYRNMLLRDDVQSNPGLVAEIYEDIGNMAALMFHFETAAYCFEKSCRFFENRQVRKKYLLCQRFLMSKEAYLEWVATKEEYYELSVDAERAYENARQQAERQMQEKANATELEVLKEEFCRMVME